MPTVEEILQNPNASTFIKTVLIHARERDVVESLQDLNIIVEALKDELKAKYGLKDS